MSILSIIPKDLDLPIPGNIGILEILIVVSFLLHILFVNITVGSSALAVFQEIKGIYSKREEDDLLAYQLSHHTSVLKSIAVVLGIAPLLIISIMYTQYFYPAMILIGKTWLALIVILITAFLFLYAYKFTWRNMKNGWKKGIHVIFGIIGSLLLLFVPLIFIVTVVSMLYPDMWNGSKGFFHSLIYYPQIWQRYFHFILASFALAGFYLYFWNQRLYRTGSKNLNHEKLLRKGKKLGVQVMFISSFFQFFTGFWLLMSFEPHIRLLYMGEDFLLTSLLVFSIILTFVMLFFLYLLMKFDQRKYFTCSIIVFILVMSLMGWMRHELRETYIKPYKERAPQTIQSQINK
ncbi:cytochrome c class I [Bacillus altitudinis]|uniref:cytochrome c class I n=1 Tax=Bacillus altitudinis TaxID=293387 RepID=UPI001071D763|nr:cytochrome c class I [Bacillus altitudinis]QEO62804.1 cytochrome c class I [Bacillus altitudinis]